MYKSNHTLVSSSIRRDQIIPRNPAQWATRYAPEAEPGQKEGPNHHSQLHRTPIWQLWRRRTPLRRSHTSRSRRPRRKPGRSGSTWRGTTAAAMMLRRTGSAPRRRPGTVTGAPTMARRRRGPTGRWRGKGQRRRSSQCVGPWPVRRAFRWSSPANSRTQWAKFLGLWKRLVLKNEMWLKLNCTLMQEIGVFIFLGYQEKKAWETGKTEYLSEKGKWVVDRLLGRLVEIWECSAEWSGTKRELGEIGGKIATFDLGFGGFYWILVGTGMLYSTALYLSLL